MEINKIRAVQLGLAVEVFFSGSRKDCSEAVDLPAGLISQWINGKRNMGERVARKIEDKLELPTGWLDLPEEKLNLLKSNIESALAYFQPNFPSIESLAGSIGHDAQKIEIARTTGVITKKLERAFEHAFNLPVGGLYSPVLQFGTSGAQNRSDSSEQGISPNASVEGSSIIPWEEEGDLPKDEFVFIPRLSINGSCGNGVLNWHIEEKGQRQAFRRSWVNSIGINPKNCATIQAVGDSMTPRIQNSDSLVIDLADTQVRDGRVYAIAWADEMLVKRIFKLHDGSLRFVSDNKDYEPRDVPAHDLELVRIVGRVVAVSGAM